MLSRVVSNDTCTVSWGQFFSRRGIGASAGGLPKIGLPAEVQRDLAATLSVARPKPAARDGHRPLEPNGGNIVGAVIIRLVGALMLEQSDEWAVSRRYFSLESLASLADTDPRQLSASGSPSKPRTELRTGAPTLPAGARPSAGTRRSQLT